MSIISISEWEGIYDPTTISVVLCRSLTTRKISEHFYKNIRLSLVGEVAYTMDSNTEIH